jgi:hypothetical protein
MQHVFLDHYRLPRAATGLDLGRNAETARPRQLSLAYHYRPTPSFFLGNVPLLKKLLKLLRALALQWPQAVTRPPVAYYQLRPNLPSIQRLFRIIS